MHVGLSTPFYNNMSVAWALQTPVNINMHEEAIRMERSCLVVVQHKHSIGKLSSWPESSSGQCLKVRCKMSTLKPAAENSLCQLSSLSKSSDVSVLFFCFSWSFFFSAGHLSNLSFHDLLFHR